MTSSFTVLYKENPDGWITSWIPEYSGAISQGRTKAEAREMVLDALNELMLAAGEISPAWDGPTVRSRRKWPPTLRGCDSRGVEPPGKKRGQARALPKKLHPLPVCQLQAANCQLRKSSGNVQPI